MLSESPTILATALGTPRYSMEVLNTGALSSPDALPRAPRFLVVISTTSAFGARFAGARAGADRDGVFRAGALRAGVLRATIMPLMWKRGPLYLPRVAPKASVSDQSGLERDVVIVIARATVGRLAFARSR